MPGPTLPTPEQVAYMQEHASDNIVPNLIACATICPILATIFVAFRLWSRRINHGRLKLDASDYLSIAAWLFLIDENIYAVVLALLKFSILSLYRKLFGNTRWLYILSWAVTALVAELALQVIIATNLQCIPISATWDPSIHGKCINYGVEALVAYIINISTDITILLMPIPVVRKLQASKSKKRGLLAVFVAGGSACIVSMVQLRYITNLGSTADGSWDSMPSIFLADVEIMVGFLATSIATYRPLYRRVFKGIVPSSSQNYRPGYSDGSRRYNHVTRIFAGGKPTDHSSSTNNSRGIVVTDQIELIRTTQPAGSYDGTTGPAGYYDGTTGPAGYYEGTTGPAPSYDGTTGGRTRDPSMA
ncbi:hypothetical protein INS49_006802 [Diaporthe citri]|uniref:uncharacterized protein n=1 Tax=Diaporthe citri TaxID=83186 RepID=UPI001C81E686|nr:uncharacterized protein INS49_006802 [Diaporthe citri]KAG6365194.1 hypothetical protein INS49_006802 [Diaporthe citri]